MGTALVAIGLLTAAMVAGKPSLCMIAAPFAASALAGMRDRRGIEITGKIDLDRTTVLEGEELAGVVTLSLPGGSSGRVLIEASPGWSPVEPGDALSWSVDRSDATFTRPFRIRADDWGRHRLGFVHVTLRRPLGHVVWEVRADASPTFDVLPRPERVRQLLPPPASQSAVGLHRSRAVGDGFEFAELRPFQPGDRLRDVNWRATARAATTQVNRRHPDRAGDVVLLLDTFGEMFGPATRVTRDALARSARAAWSIAGLHFNAQDRVGLAAQGRVVGVLQPSSGDRARYALLNALLSIGGAMASGTDAGGEAHFDRLPPSSLLIALTPLADRRMVDRLAALHRSGRSVAVVVVDLMDLLPPPKDEAALIARELFELQLTELRDQLVELGVPLAVWGADGDIAGTVAALRRTGRIGSGALRQ